MNFRNLRYFLAAAEEKNITRAAQKLYISQQSLSGHIAKLEEELGVSLFERGPQLKLSFAGERLRLLAERICSLEQELLRETQEISDSRRGRLRLGLSYTCGRVLLPYVLPEFCAVHPLVEVSLTEGNHRQINEWLARGEVDVVLDYSPLDVVGAEVFPLLRERLFLVCPKALTDAALGPEAAQAWRGGTAAFDLHAFREQPFILLKGGNRIRAMFDAYTEKTGFLPAIRLETENIETAFALAEQGMGLTVYPELFLSTLHRGALSGDAPLDLFPFPGEETEGALALAFMERDYRSPAVLDFIALCKQKSGLWQLGMT